MAMNYLGIVSEHWPQIKQ